MKFWLQQMAVAFDQFCNALAGGWADETFSSRCWRLRARPFWGLARRVVDCLLFFDPGHCEASYQSEVKRLQAPPETRAPVAEKERTG